MIRALLSILLLFGVAACDSGKPSPVEATPALWEVRGPDGERGYLFATIHARPEAGPWKSPEIEAALDGADVLVLEAADLDNTLDRQAIYTELARRVPSMPLCARLAQADCSALDDAVDEAGLKPAQLAALDTWAAALAIANARGKAGSSEHGIDRALLAETRLPVVELEGTRGQLSIFDRLPEKEQLDLLGFAITASDDDSDTIDTAAAWARGDMDAIALAARRGMLSDPELREALLVGRNAEWVRKIERMLRAGKRAFVAVGAAHLAGGDGLPALLAARGWTVRRTQ